MASSSMARPSPAPAISPLPATTSSVVFPPRSSIFASGACEWHGLISLGAMRVQSLHRCILPSSRYVVEAGAKVNPLVREGEEDTAVWDTVRSAKGGENVEVEQMNVAVGEQQEVEYEAYRDEGSSAGDRWRGLDVMPSPSSGGSAQAQNVEAGEKWRWVKDSRTLGDPGISNRVAVGDFLRQVQDAEGGTAAEFLYVDDDFGGDSGDAALRGSEGEAETVPVEYRPLPINLDLRLYEARCLRRKGQYAEAESLLRKLIKEWPGDGRAYVSLAKTLVLQRRLQEARTVFENGCQAVSGENAYIWQAWACLEERLGQISKARQLFDAATVADKKHAAAWHGWAILELREGNTKKAVSLLNRGLRLCRPNEYIHQTLALIEARAKNYDAARTNFAKATEINVKSAASWVAWAAMEAELDRPSAARRLFQKGLEASPKNRYVWQTWGIFEADQGNRDRARELFKRGHELNPKDPVLLQAWGLFEYKCCGNYQIAGELFQQAVNVDPRHQPVWVAWGWMESKKGNIDAARELFKRAILVDSKSMDAIRAYQAWGVMEEREGNFGVARELFKSALKVDSQNVPTWMAWAAMEERLENFVRADELRNLCLQQRTEVVEGISWDVDNIADLLAPAIDKLKGFFSLDWSNKQDKDQLGADNLEAIAGDSSTTEEFDISAFLRKTFPWRYVSEEKTGSSSRSSKFASRQDLREQEEEA